LSITDDLYREIVLEHFRNPRNAGRLPQPTVVAHGANPFCGDEIELTLLVEHDALRDLRVEAKGCSISQAAASMMTEAVKGKTIAQAETMVCQFKAAMLENAPMGESEEWEDLRALHGVKKYPVRIKCALLSWNTLLQAIHAHRQGQGRVTHTEGEEGEETPLAKRQEPIVPQKHEGATIGLDRVTQVQEALKGVIDPELNMNVVDLGLIYDIEIHDGSVRITYTLTSPGCPLGPVIQEQIRSVLSRLPWIQQIETQLVWSPPWDPRTMASEEVKAELGLW